jgi:hypothetical protein
MSKSKPTTFFDVFCKRRGYICSVGSHDEVMSTLKSLYHEHEKHFRKLSGSGRRIPSFACYGVQRTGNDGHKITFSPELNNDSDWDLPDYEDVKNV